MPYFSNHSQSTRHTPAVPAVQPDPPQPSAPLPASRSRASSSKHFSTSLQPYTDDKAQGKDKPATPALSGGVHPLRHTWVFWFRQQRPPGNKITSYEEGIKKIASFSSVESFWSLWTHLYSPSALLPTTDYLLFHSGIRRPVWEDPLNLDGGKWIVRLKKGVADRIWEDLVLAIIGDQFDDCRSVPPPSAPEVNNNGEHRNAAYEWPEICGCTISVRQSEDIVTLWNRVDADVKVREKIRDILRTVLNLPPSTIMEYKSNNDSMQDKSSFRNSAIDRTPLA